jgi:uncharacterized membrane protein YhaH (DUF805 family)
MIWRTPKEAQKNLPRFQQSAARNNLFLFNTLAREGLGPIYVISNLALLVPGLAISARHLHDIDRTEGGF